MKRSQSKDCRPLVAFVVAAVWTLLQSTSSLWAGMGPIPPPGTHVYLVPSGSNGGVAHGRNVYFLLYEWLKAGGCAVEQLSAATDPQRVIESEQFPLVFVVVIGGTDSLLTARIYATNSGNPRLLQAEGRDAELKLAGAVLRHITETLAKQYEGSTEARNAAIAHFQRGEYQEALQLFQKAQRGGRDVDTLFNIALCLDGLNKRAEAEKILEDIHQQNPNHEEAAISLAGRYLDEKKFGPAIAIFSRWSDSAKSGPVARYNLGIAYLRTGNLRQARDYLTTIPKDDSRYEAAANLVVEIDKRLSTISKKTDAAPATKGEQPISIMLKYWSPLAVVIPILLVLVFRRRVRPSITVELGRSASGQTVCVSNTSAGEVALFALSIRVFETGAKGEQEIRSLTSDLAAGTQCVLELGTSTGVVRVTLAGEYYLFPRVRAGAFRFRRTVEMVPGISTLNSLG